MKAEKAKTPQTTDKLLEKSFQVGAQKYLNPDKKKVKAGKELFGQMQEKEERLFPPSRD